MVERACGGGETSIVRYRGTFEGTRLDCAGSRDTVSGLSDDTGVILEI